MTGFLTLLAALVAAGASLYTALTARTDQTNQHRRENAAELHLAMLDLTSSLSRSQMGEKDARADLADADTRIMNHNPAIPDENVRNLVEDFRRSVSAEALVGNLLPETAPDRKKVQREALLALEAYRRTLG